MNWKIFCCCLYLYSRSKSEEGAPLDNGRSENKPFSFIGGVINWTKEKRKAKAGCTHDHLHQALGREVGDTETQHVYARPTQSAVEAQSTAAESVSLVQKIVGNRLYKTFEKNNNKQRNQLPAAPSPCERGPESSFDSFEATESFDADAPSEPSLHVTGSLTNRNPRAASEYQNMPQYQTPQSDYRYPDNRRVSQPNIPPPPPRCYYNQPNLDRRGFQSNLDTRRQIKSFQ